MFAHWSEDSGSLLLRFPPHPHGNCHQLQAETKQARVTRHTEREKLLPTPHTCSPISPPSFRHTHCRHCLLGWSFSLPRSFLHLPPRGGRGSSVDLDGRIDLAEEEVGGVEADGSREQPEGQHHDEGVAKVEQRRDELGDFKLHTQGARREGELGGTLSQVITYDQPSTPSTASRLIASLTLCLQVQ